MGEQIRNKSACPLAFNLSDSHTHPADMDFPFILSATLAPIAGFLLVSVSILFSGLDIDPCVICRILFPIGRTITCPESGFIPCSIGSKLCCKNESFDAYLLLWSHLGTIKCPLVHPGNSEGQITKNAALF